MIVIGRAMSVLADVTFPAAIEDSANPLSAKPLGQPSSAPQTSPLFEAMPAESAAIDVPKNIRPLNALRRSWIIRHHQSLSAEFQRLFKLTSSITHVGSAPESKIGDCRGRAHRPKGK